MPVLIQWRREMEKFFERYFGEFYTMVFFHLDYYSCPARDADGGVLAAGSECPVASSPPNGDPRRKAGVSTTLRYRAPLQVVGHDTLRSTIEPLRKSQKMQFLIREMAQKHVPRIFPASVCATY